MKVYNDENFRLCDSCIHFNKECEYPFSRMDMKRNKDGHIVECLYYKKHPRCCTTL